ncbi:aspartyl protease family protein [Sphingosinicella sp. BN140058]|uniref:aspartyl protease family protein n=1 Tax=Sphingosinicella sp. BN140058 TaxID=1892855 RepID=UPI0010106E65|nr:retroviral-like aspartic protease family protein [Sphingosinicella sp. BN140058]QAY76373.1 hypothetical protein ETR14_07615 [Sphingosinicella sp. BN140058]
MPRASSHVLLSLLSGAILACAGLAGAAPADAAAAAVKTDRFDAAILAARVGATAQLEQLLPGLDPAARALAEAQLAATRLGGPDADAALARYFALGDQDRDRRARALEIASEVAFAKEDYAEAVRQADAFLALSPDRPAKQIENMRQTRVVAAILAQAPAQRVDSIAAGRPANGARDKVGLLRVAMAAGGAQAQAVVDTGANVSVVNASTAKALGLRMLDGEAAVGNSIGADVPVRIAIADSLHFAGATLRNVPFAVLDDKALDFPMVPGGYRIEAIVGLPVLRALGRVTFGPGDALTIAAAPSGPAPAPNLLLIGNDLYAQVAIAGRVHPLFLDTGAASTALYKRFAAERPDLRPTDSGKSQGKGGVGGSTTVRVASLGPVPIAIGTATREMKSIDVELADDANEEERYGVLGNDVLRAFDGVTLDFRRGTIEAAPR